MDDEFLQTFLHQFQHLKIPLKEITSATNNFEDKSIGVGGFGKVYRGELSHSKGRSTAAIKRLDPKNGQGIPEFLKEITMLTDYKHENLISLLGFCYERGEMILVYELAFRGSLDRHLSSPDLTWTQRLKICLDAARGLGYLHDPMETHRRLIHCDIKSANILLDDQWNAKVSDFGLSIMGSANEQHSVIVTNAAGTPGYCDPQYARTHTLTKESDVYSFGVVLFEVLCGRLCRTYSSGRVEKNFVPTWIESYKQRKLNDVIFKNPTNQPLDPSALEAFADIAYQCLEEFREDRPNMAEVVIELERALEILELLDSQEFSEWKGKLFYYEEITKTAEPPLIYRSEVGFMKLLYQGILLNEGKTWFSINQKGEHCEMISFAECLDSSSASEFGQWLSAYGSRFAVGSYCIDSFNESEWSAKTRVQTQFLSPGITYTVNLVFKFMFPTTARCHHLMSLKYKLQGETETSISYIACERDDGWWMCELCQLTSDHKTVDLEIMFEGLGYMLAEGIEFLPLEEKVEQHKDERQIPISDSDSNWEEKLPTDYEDMMRWSTMGVQWTTKKEAYSTICKGLFINYGQRWLSLDQNGKKCHMLSARAVRTSTMYDGEESGRMLTSPESRFGEVLHWASWALSIYSEIQPQLVSAETTYACYLVYKIQKHQPIFEAPLEVKIDLTSDNYWYVYLVCPRTPVIRPKAGQNTHNPVNRPRIKGIPQRRNDGWLEVQIWEFQTAATTEMICMHPKLRASGGKDLSGLIIEGFEFRPI